MEAKHEIEHAPVTRSNGNVGEARAAGVDCVYVAFDHEQLPRTVDIASLSETASYFYRTRV